MLTTLIVQPIFNLLAFIYAVLPGHNFGFAIIIFTIVVRLAMWPLLKKQLHSAKNMRKLQPELKRIKKEAAGNKSLESQMTMELYKEKGINPFSSLGLVILQVPILLGLYAGLRHIVNDPHAIYTFAYPFVQNLPWMKELAHDAAKFDQTLFGIIDLTKSAVPKGGGGIYWPAMFLVLGSAVTQYYQSKQLMPVDKDARKLRDILRGASKGTPADSSEVNAAVSRGTRYFIPVMIFFITLNIASALSLYWFVGGLVALIQQSRVLKDDEEEMEEIADKPDKKSKKSKRDLTQIAEAEIVSTPEKSSKSAAKKPAPKVKGNSTVTKITRSSDTTTASTPKPTPSKKSKKRRRR